MRILIIGGSGLLGKALLREWRSDEVVAPRSRECDIRDRHQTQGFITRLRPEYTVLAAAYTDVDGCEKNPALAMDVNCSGAANVAFAAREAGSRLMFLSTDYVFDGFATAPYETTDPVNPINIYGQSKAEAERTIQCILPNACILRTSWLFGTDGKCFPQIILALAKKSTSLPVVDDQQGCPTFNRDLAKAIVALVHGGVEGIVHATNQGSCTWHQFASELVSAAGLTGIEIEAVKSIAFPRPARRPAYSVLSGTSLKRHGISLPSWRQAVVDYVADWAKLEMGIAT